MVARLNHICREIASMQEYLYESSLIQRYISIPAGRLIQKSSQDKKYFNPVDKLIEHLNHHYGEDKTASPLLNIELYQLKVQLILEEFEVWRKVLVPSTFSFRHLHNIIQLLFDWHNCHLHMFEAKKKGTKPKQIVMDDILKRWDGWILKPSTFCRNALPHSRRSFRTISKLCTSMISVTTGATK